MRLKAIGKFSTRLDSMKAMFKAQINMFVFHMLCHALWLELGGESISPEGEDLVAITRNTGFLQGAGPSASGRVGKLRAFAFR